MSEHDPKAEAAILARNAEDHARAMQLLTQTREKAYAVLDHLPADRVEAALAALEAVEGRDTSIEAIVARQGEQRLDPEEFERHFGSLPDGEG